MLHTVAVLDDKNRYWEIDVEVSEGSDDFVYNEQWYPGDESEVFILSGVVELKSKKGTKKTIKVGPEFVENYISIDTIIRRL